MQSLLLTDAEATKEADFTADKPRYPYGTCLYLDQETLEKLGMVSLPDVGEEMILTAKVKVVGVSARENTDGANKSLELQITDMQLDEAEEKRTDLDRANMLYGA